jgi:hypothetical protein
VAGTEYTVPTAGVDEVSATMGTPETGGTVPPHDVSVSFGVSDMTSDDNDRSVSGKKNFDCSIQKSSRWYGWNQSKHTGKENSAIVVREMKE